MKKFNSIRYNIIEINNLYFSYHDTQTENKKNILRNINLNIKQGDFVALIGKNGSGKSTLLKILKGLLEPCSGSVKVCSKDNNGWNINHEIGMIFQNPDNQIVASIVEDDIAFTLENLGINQEKMPGKILACLKQVGMEKYIKHATFALSGGQKQKIAIAGVLAMNPKCILLDEATSMLDPKSRDDILKTIYDLNKILGMTVIMVTHHIEEVKNADRLIVLDEGKIVLDDAPLECFKTDVYRNLELEYPITIQLCNELNLSYTFDVLAIKSCLERSNCNLDI